MALSCPTEELHDFIAPLRKKAAKKRIPLSGTFAITHRCTFKCLHCYLGSQDAIRTHKNEELTTDEIKGIIDQLAKAGTLFLNLTGGEPLLRKDFPEIYTYAVRKGLLVRVFTNGSLINDDIISLWQKYPPLIVDITIYAASDTTYERVTQTKGAFSLCQQGVERLQKGAVRYSLKTMLLTCNVHEFAEIEKAAQEFDVPFRYDALIFPCLPNSDNHGYSNVACSESDGKHGISMKRLFPENNDCSQVNRISRSMLAPLTFRLSPEKIVEIDLENDNRRKPFANLLKEIEIEGNAKIDKLFSCGAVRFSYHITPYGKLTPCIAAIEPEVDIRQKGFQEGWEGQLKKLTEITVEKDSECYGCNYRQKCTVCPSRLILETGNYNIAAPELCETIKKRIVGLAEIKKNQKGISDEKNNEH